MTKSPVLRHLPRRPMEEGSAGGRAELLATLAQAIEDGAPGAQYRLGKMFLAREDPLMAMMLFRSASSNGHWRSRRKIRALCRREDGSSGDHENVAHWYRSFADEGDPTAQVALALFYELGRGVEQSTKEAIRWLGRAAKQGQLRFEAELAIGFEYWLGAEQEPEASEKWLRLAAEQGWSLAQSVLARNYLYGKGVEKDPDKVERLMLLCCRGGNVESMASVASLYATGKGLGQDHKKAVKWYRRVFGKVDAEDLFEFGRDFVEMLRMKQGGNRCADPIYIWFKLAASKGHVAAREACVLMERELPEEHLRAPRMIARKCIRSRRRTKRSRRRRRPRRR